MYNNIASVYRNLKQNEKSKEYFFKCLEIKLSVYAATHPSIASTYVNIAEIEYVLKNKKEALNYF